MSDTILKILAAQLKQRRAVAAATAGAGAARQLHVAVTVENPGNAPLHVWASRRGYEYDAASGVLTLYLTDHTPAPPPGIEIISHHPRTPQLVQVPPKARATLEVPVPATIRRRVPGLGLGIQFVEEPIDAVTRIDLHIQSATEPIRSTSGESPDQFRKRLLAHGDVAHASIAPQHPKE